MSDLNKPADLSNEPPLPGFYQQIYIWQQVKRWNVSCILSFERVLTLSNDAANSILRSLLPRWVRLTISICNISKVCKVWAWKDLETRDETESTAADTRTHVGSAFSFILASCIKASPRWFVRPWLRCIIQRTAWKAGLQIAASLTITTRPEEHRRVKLARRRNKTGRRRTIQATILMLKCLLLLSVCLIR